MKTSYQNVSAYRTKDGSEIRELMHPRVHGHGYQSLAEAIVWPGEQTHRHRHRITEEIYHVTSGVGSMNLGDDCFVIRAGDTIRIAPGVPHSVTALEEAPLHILCCCSPAYTHEDTEMENEPSDYEALPDPYSGRHCAVGTT
ncbi:MAG: cupin domain-containing protein [Magnetococcales bacterium]|nr:cupin domain-containing protein [Magnetococcales bacterium]